MTTNVQLGEFTIEITAYRCRCGHVWANRDLHSNVRPRVCPKCKSANWDQPYRDKRGSAAPAAG